MDKLKYLKYIIIKIKMNIYRENFCWIILLILLINTNCQFESLTLDNLYENVDSTYMENVISNLSSLFEGYVYLDIAKNPPNSIHPKIDLKNELNSIDTTINKTFYDFYRDVKRITSKMKDLHFMPIPTFNNASNYIACIPFSFQIKIDKNNNYQLHMKKNFNCPFTYDDINLNEFIDTAIEQNLSISLINDTDPFDFIQNFGKDYLDLKNKHSRFTAIMKYISNFPLYFIPLNESELILKIKLSNELEQNFSYFFFIFPAMQDKTINKFNLNENDLGWNYTVNGFKCKVDEINKYNIFYQNTFIFSSMETIKDAIYNCSKLFHENDYKIIGIESRNEGGSGIIGIYLEQLLQPKICTNKMLFSFRRNAYLEENFENLKKNFLDQRTCENPESIDKFFSEKSDYYGNITHNKTIILDEITLDMKSDLHIKRQELIKTKKTKKPTDIIIFTDYHSFSATSIFLKSFQQSGGAIIVGYYGNPKDNETIRDSSISSSGILNYEWTNFQKNLENLNFHFQITGQEFFYYDYQKENPTPQEYITIPVDEYVDIYEEYSDDIYDKFINYANIIFDKYKDKCNINNKLLLLEDEECYDINNNEHAHGGFVCGYNGEWNKSQCQAFYCDIGYYYDTYQNKCIEDICTKGDNNKNEEYTDIPIMIIIIIVGIGIIVLIIALVLIRRTINIKKMNNNEKKEENALLMD